MKSLQVKKWVAWVVLGLVVLGLGYVVALKFDVLSFSILHTEETRYASQRYNEVQKAAGLLYKEGFATPINVAK